MPIEDNWRKLIPEQIMNAPDFAGVYELADILQETLFVGHTKSLAHTIQELFENKPPEFATVNFFRFHATTDYKKEYEQLLEEYKEKHNKLPPINEKKDNQ